MTVIDSLSGETQIETFTRFAAARSERTIHDYTSLWQWSVDEPAAFWRAVWDFYDLDATAV
ncbi:MAG: hypothetical protein SW127_05885, partial [Actinomycetota bacterium]|nr:hypothetical protein [Actinomycetota bacterium]